MFIPLSLPVKDLNAISVDNFLALLMDIVGSALSCTVTIFCTASLASRSAIASPAILTSPKNYPYQLRSDPAPIICSVRHDGGDGGSGRFYDGEHRCFYGRDKGCIFRNIHVNIGYSSDGIGRWRRRRGFRLSVIGCSFVFDISVCQRLKMTNTSCLGGCQCSRITPIVSRALYIVSLV